MITGFTLPMNIGDQQWKRVYDEELHYNSGLISRKSFQEWIFDTFPEGGEGKSALDISCGNGRNMRFLHEYGFDGRGFDLIPKAVANTQRLLEEKCGLESRLTGEIVLPGDVRDSFPFPGKYDLQLAYAVFHLIDQAEDMTVYEGIQNAFSELKKHAAPEGLIYTYFRGDGQLALTPDIGEVIESPGTPLGGSTYRVNAPGGIEHNFTWHLFTVPEIYHLAEESGLSLCNPPKPVHQKDGPESKAGIKERFNYEVIMRPLD
jgi:SAM-dependent methyltransferase